MILSKSMPFVKSDGGRTAAGYVGDARDCACRAIAIAAQMPYRQVYDLINDLAKCERRGKRKRSISHARTGVYRTTMKKLLEEYLNWTWTPTMKIGEGCTVHLAEGELPAGRLIARVSRHYVAVIDGVLYDTHDSSRGGTRCVYGYWSPPEEFDE